MGLTKDDLHAIEGLSDVAKAEGGFSQDMLLNIDDNQKAVSYTHLDVYKRQVYVDTNVMAGRTGVYDAKTEMWSDVIYMPCTAENGFAPELPKETPEDVYKRQGFIWIRRMQQQ